MPDIKKIADEADVIVAGYAFKKSNEGIRVLNLNTGKGAAVFQN